MDVEQRGDSIVVCADLPGIRKEDVRIDVDEDGLAISGERRDEREQGGGDRAYHLVERSYGSFYRVVPLPPGVDREQIRAAMRDGVLTVTVPLPQEAQRRRVEIQG